MKTQLIIMATTCALALSTGAQAGFEMRGAPETAQGFSIDAAPVEPVENMGDVDAMPPIEYIEETPSMRNVSKTAPVTPETQPNVSNQAGDIIWNETRAVPRQPGHTMPNPNTMPRGEDEIGNMIRKMDQGATMNGDKNDVALRQSVDPMATAPDGYYGFGKDIPLVMAMDQILPEGYQPVFDANVNMGERISWKGDGSWRNTLQRALSENNLAARIQGQNVYIAAGSGNAPMSAPAYRPESADAGDDTNAMERAPMQQDARQMSAPEFSANEPAPRQDWTGRNLAPPRGYEAEQASHANARNGADMWVGGNLDGRKVSQPVDRRPDRMLDQPVSRANTANQWDAAATATRPHPKKRNADHFKIDWSTPRTDVRQPTAEYADRSAVMEPRTVDEDSSMGAPQSMTGAPQMDNAASMQGTDTQTQMEQRPQVETANLSDQPMAEETTKAPRDTWLAGETETLRDTLRKWSEQSGTPLRWDMDYDFMLKQPVQYRGSFEEAVQHLVSRFEGVSPRPFARFGRTATGARELVIDGGGLS